MVTYRLTRRPFGLTCSPFLLAATLTVLATMCRGYRKAVALMTSISFMDDFLAGVEDGNGAIHTYYEFNALIRTIELPMAKWATSCQEPKEIWKV